MKVLIRLIKVDEITSQICVWIGSIGRLMAETLKPQDHATIAEEIHKISHDMRSALSVLQVGTQLFERSKAEGASIAPLMQTKITQVNDFCTRLSDLSDMLKK